MKQENVPPEPLLMESMRSVGYTLNTSIADIVDNSIAAKASRIWIDSSDSGDAFVAITDDGTGMDSNEAKRSMQLAAAGPIASRASTDLGRFGLGLKTASLAQCRTLTVVSKKSGSTVAYRWSLDHLLASRTWSLLRLNQAEIKALPGVERLIELGAGTLVLWQDLDQLQRNVGVSQRDLDEAMAQAGTHLALVFHRFISGDSGDALSLYLNGTALAAIDPFLVSNRATDKGPLEKLTIHGESIRVQPYTLPLISKLTRRDKETALITGSLRESQGFYVYRARRLVIWGTWFRLVPRNDLGKLARVKVDIPNSLDHLWSLDIKKSVASPPPEVRQELKRLSMKIVQPSHRVQKFRGRKAADQDAVTRVWQVIADRDHFRYQLNREHPILTVLSSSLEPAALRSLEQLLQLAETTFPVQDVHNRMGQDESYIPGLSDEDELIVEALMFWSIFSSTGRSLDDFIAAFESIEPFDQLIDFGSLIRKAVDEQ